MWKETTVMRTILAPNIDEQIKLNVELHVTWEQIRNTQKRSHTVKLPKDCFN